MNVNVNFKAGEKVIKRVKLLDITTSHNPRNPIPKLSAFLVEEGYSKVKNDEEVPLSAIELVQETVLSDDAEKMNDFCRLVEKYEGGHDGLLFLAAGRAVKEIEPINLREFRTNTPAGYVVRYGIISGERRYLAAAYNAVKLGLPFTIGAQVSKVTKDVAEDLAFMENAQRKDMGDLEYGRYFHMKKQQIDPETQKPYTLKDVARMLGYQGEEGYQFVRSREALCHLPESDQRRLEKPKASKDKDVIPGTQRVNLTAAVRKGLRIKNGQSADELPPRKDNRQRAMNLTEIRALFDESRNMSTTECEKKMFLNALAKVMRLDYNQAITESDARLKEKESK